ncbi:hypothetical protein V5T82_16400 [Magnetovibrio sp. PR-2]|uniref:hypothetical protein n=1 Tax=Magnetovibrio sp. PR-2 TaxID=3120356 RepID=UPI002FCDE21F
MAKKGRKRGASGAGSSTDDNQSAQTPWSSAPAPRQNAKPTTAAVNVGQAVENEPDDSWQLNDALGYAPWANDPQPGFGAASATAGPMSPEARARMQASLTRFRDADPIDSYENPWGGTGEDDLKRPMTRREAIVARAAAKRRASIQGEREAMYTSQGAPDDSTEPDSDPVEQPAETKKRRKSKSRTNAKQYKIPVENLPVGVINVIGDGVVAVVDGTISAGNTVGTAMKPVVRLVPPTAATGLVCVAGAGVLLGYASAINIPWKI